MLICQEFDKVRYLCLLFCQHREEISTVLTLLLFEFKITPVSVVLRVLIKDLFIALTGNQKLMEMTPLRKRLVPLLICCMLHRLFYPLNL